MITICFYIANTSVQIARRPQAAEWEYVFVAIPLCWPLLAVPGYLLGSREVQRSPVEASLITASLLCGVAVSLVGIAPLAEFALQAWMAAICSLSLLTTAVLITRVWRPEPARA